MGRVQVRPLTRADQRAAARVLTDALVDDPGWLAVGPDRRALRERIVLRFHHESLRVTERHGGPILGAFDQDELVGVAVNFAAGLHPPPWHTTLRFVPGFLPAGPAAIARALRTIAVQERGHPDFEHVYVAFLGVAPSHQRRGIGRALLARVFEEAEAPVFLDTANPANVPYYASVGFEETGRAAMPRGATLYFMTRL